MKEKLKRKELILLYLMEIVIILRCGICKLEAFYQIIPDKNVHEIAIRYFLD